MNSVNYEAMTTNEAVITALKPLGFPVVPEADTSTAALYAVFSVSTAGSLDGDDAPEWVFRQVVLTLYSPARQNMIGTGQEIQRLLFEAGFSFPEQRHADVEMDGGRKCSEFVCGRWEPWRS